MFNPQVMTRFAICVANRGAEDLTVGMLYRVLPDETALSRKYLRIIDNSGEDYLYPVTSFVMIEVSEAEAPRLMNVLATDLT